MYSLIVALPLLGSLLAGFGGRFIGGRGAVVLTVTFVSLSFLFSTIAFYEVALSGSMCSLKMLDWFSVKMFDCEWALYFDQLTVIMLIVITSVSSLVHIYSAEYMSLDPHLPRFMSYLSIFTFFMIMLVTADNLVQMFFGWEGVGLASYLLINFWFTRIQANKASIKAMLVNRVGDFGLALGIMSCFFLFKSVNFVTIFAVAPFFSSAHLVFFSKSFHALSVIALCLFIGAVGKSAQLGLHTWLPDAMEGPTPVSALIHAATMVTAGVFMIAKCSAIFQLAPSILQCVAIIGAATAFFAATTGLVQNDLKRVIAYSTCSQLGYMVFALGISQYSVAVFHLMNHAFFKALLFLGAGSVIHALSNQQDMRKMGGLSRLLPFTYAMMLIGTLALVGFPFLTGFYSKDVILEVAYARYTISGHFAYWLGSFCVLATSYYSFRLLILTFFMNRVDKKAILHHVHEAPTGIAIPLILLAIASIFVGFLGKDMMIGLGTQFWGNALFVQPSTSNFVESEYPSLFVKNLPLISTFCGVILSLLINYSPVGTSSTHKASTARANTEHAIAVPSSRYKQIYSVKTSPIGIYLYTLLNKRWFWDKVYNDFLAQNTLSFGHRITFKGLDKGCFQIVGPVGMSQSILHIARNLSRLQSGIIYHYAVLQLIGLTVFISTVGLLQILTVFVDSRLYLIVFIAFLSITTIKELYTVISKPNRELAFDVRPVLAV